MLTRWLSCAFVLAACVGPATPEPEPGFDPGSTERKPRGIGGTDATAAITCGSTATLGSIASDGALVLASFTEPAEGGAPADSFSLGSDWTAYATVLPSGHGTVYALDDDGRIHWYRYRDGMWVSRSGSTIATGWADRTRVVSGGDGVFYSVDAQGQLIWDRHIDPFAGSADAWRSDGGSVIGEGWGDFVDIVPGGDGVLYAIDHDGALHWYRHLDPFGGDARWAPGSGAIIGADWDAAAAVMSAGGGVLYAALDDGTLLWFRHLDPVDGASSWQQLDGVAIANTMPTLGDPAACYLGAGPVITEGPQLTYGLHPRASDALRAIGIDTDRITQTIGSAPASAGTHAQDGTADGLAYSAATDLSVRGWTEAQIKVVLEQLGQVGFAAWYRKPGYDGWPASDSPHIHAVYAGCAMKLTLRDQVRDWLQDKNGLVSHTTYQFFDWSEFSHDRVRKLFLAENPGVN